VTDLTNNEREQLNAIAGDLAQVLNAHSIDSITNTPDHVLARFLTTCTGAYLNAKEANDEWHGGPNRTIRGTWGPLDPPTETPPTAGHAEFAAEVGRLRQDHDVRRLEAEVDGLIAERDRLREQLEQRDGEIGKRRASHHALQHELEAMRTERDKAVHQLDKVRADRQEANNLVASLITARDKANHRHRREKARADRYCRDAEAAERRLEQIAAVLNRTPFPPDRDQDTEPGARWDPANLEFRPWAPDHRPDPDELADAMRPRPTLVPLEQVRDQVDGLIADRTPGPRRGPTPARPPRTTGDATATPADIAAGYPFRPDYTEADVEDGRR
jgi:hypothetical protein